MCCLIFGVFFVVVNGDIYDVKYASIVEKYVFRFEVGASTEVMLNV